MIQILILCFDGKITLRTQILYVEYTSIMSKTQEKIKTTNKAF